MKTQSQLLIATNNPGKLKEITCLLELENLTLLSPEQIGLLLEAEETGSSYAENAQLKAKAFADASGLTTLADDSGLEVDALNGEPGLHSARLIPKPGATDADRRQLLLGRLREFPRPWTARFRCVVALTDPSGRTEFAEGVCEGEIIPEERGVNGFGYDPIFLIPDLGKTMAELEMLEKNEISHRAAAIKAAVPLIWRFLAK